MTDQPHRTRSDKGKPRKADADVDPWYARNREKVLARVAAYRQNHKAKADEWSRRHHLQKTYGITVEEYERRFAEQHGLCAICGLPPQLPAERRLAVDHDHATGRVRGLLCNRCNTALAEVEKDGWVGRARAYLDGLD